MTKQWLVTVQDKPDTFRMELIDVSEIVKDAPFKVFSGAVESGGQVKLINLKIKQKTIHVKISMKAGRIRSASRCKRARLKELPMKLNVAQSDVSSKAC